MAKVAARKAGAARVAAAIGLDRAGILFELRPRQMQPSIGRVDLAVPPETRRRDTIELVDAAFDAAEQVFWFADAEQVARPAFGQVRDRPVDHGMHVSLRLAE